MERQATGSGYRYRDFPGVFWDAAPDAAIEVEKPEVLARILSTRRMDVIAKLVTPELLRRKLEDLPIPDPRRRFWRLVLEQMPARAGA
ncbi:MAG: hypothetical protein HY703_12955 [Gemmatimonadetes bacterium]|nr:hypothetical protein [Gemmatimonadota bacterium]